MYDSRLIANRFLDLAEKQNDTLTPMQVLKLVFIAHGWTLGLLGRPLIRDEVEAWQYGPVIPVLYRAVRQFKSQPVRGPLPCNEADKIADDERDIVDQVYELYGARSGPALSRLTHMPNTPWSLTYEPGSFGLVISDDLIEDYYSKLAADQDN